MPEENRVQTEAAISGSQRMRLKQILNSVIDQLTDQLTQVEQTISQGLPDLAVGLTSARNMRELEAILKQLRLPQPDSGKKPVREALISAAAMSWRDERSWAQAREQALEKGVANLLQAAWLGSALKRQAVLTEGLMAARELMDSGEGNESEEHH